MIVNALVEGDLDEAVAARVITTTGHNFGETFGKRGYRYIRQKVGGFNLAAKGSYYLTLVDLMDTGLPCAPNVIERWIPHREHQMLFRVVVREIESWLLADADHLAAHLHVNIGLMPARPEILANPKETLVSIARRSRSRMIRESIVPPAGSTARVGRLYNSELIRFVATYWIVGEARRKSPSLNRCLTALEAL